MKLFLFLVDEVAMFLAWFAFFDEVLTIRFYSRPEVTGTKDSGSHSACAEMVAANAFMQLLNDVLCLFCSDTFEKRLAISALVKIITYHGISGGLSQPSFFSIRWRVAGLEILDIRSGPIVGLGIGWVVGWGVG